MESFYLITPIAIVFVIIAVKLFFWAVDSGQYDDMDSEGDRILFDDEKPAPSPSATEEPPKHQ